MFGEVHYIDEEEEGKWENKVEWLVSEKGGLVLVGKGYYWFFFFMATFSRGNKESCHLLHLTCTVTVKGRKS